MLKYCHCEIFEIDTGAKIYDSKKRLYEHGAWKETVFKHCNLVLASFLRGCEKGHELSLSISVSESDPMLEQKQLFKNVY